MKKQLTGSLAATAALLAIAGVVQAAPAELNIYGASAQYLYWNAQAKNYALNNLHCAAASDPKTVGGKHGLVVATDCSSTLVPINTATGKRDINIRYSGIASAEGPLSVSKQAPLDASLATGCNQANGERLMMNDAGTAADTCKQVHIGTADVAGESLTQSSQGQLYGPRGGGDFTVALTGVDCSSLTPANTVVVPFGFFVNEAVKAKTCTAGLVGNYCADGDTTGNSQCDSAPGKGDGVCGAASTITNISREQAAIIFSGYASNWKDLGDYFNDLPVVACLRHAGSGTHSALDLTVMNGGWGANMVATEVPGQIWFNQGSSDEIKCVNGNSTANATGALIGAIGYADGDQAIGVAGTSQNVKQLKYNGYYPTRTAIRNGLYDFYTDAWMYTNPANSATVNALADDLIAFAQLAENVPDAKKNYWAATSEMKFNRQADNGYPVFVGGGGMLP